MNNTENLPILHFGFCCIQVFCGQSSHKGVQEQWGSKQLLPQWEANVLVLQHMECRWVGNQRWAWEDRLEESPICVLLQRLQCWWVPMGRPLPCMRLHHNKELVGPIWCLAPLWCSENGLCLDTEKSCYLWLLQGFWTLPNFASGVPIESMGMKNSNVKFSNFNLGTHQGVFL